MTDRLLPARLFLDRLTLEHPAAERRVLCAVSGGLDSMCLLHFMINWGAERGFDVAAAHFNHQLRETAGRDEAFVRDWCGAENIPFFAGRGDVRAHAAREGLTTEEAGRNLRYAFLEETAARAGCAWILTAHHADDNAETLLLNLVRGTGAKGLCGIPAMRDNIARPFLQISRAELADYADAHRIPHVEDETNANPDAAARNLIRLRVMPLLKELNPRAAEHMGRTAAILTREDAVLSELAETLAGQARPVPDGGLRISRQALLDAPGAVAERAVLELLAAVGGQRKDLSAGDVDAALALAAGPPGRELHLSRRLAVCAEREELHIFQQSPLTQVFHIAPGETAAFGEWRVTLAPAPGPGIVYPVSLPEGGALSVTPWRGRDRMTLPGANGARSLKRLCADAGLRPWQRDLLPVLRAGETPVAVPGVGTDVRFIPNPGGKSLFVSFWRPDGPSAGREETTGMNEDLCPHCGGKEFVVGKQSGCANVKANKALTFFREAPLCHIICANCGTVVRSFVQSPKDLRTH